MKTYWMHTDKNWGDVFTPVLLEHYGIKFEWAPSEEAELFCCGSMLERVPKENFRGYVLGSGMGYEDTRPDLSKVKAPLLLRGKLTAERSKLGQEPRFGDPGILAAKILSEGAQPKIYEYGVVPHIVDKDNPEVKSWSSRALIIDIESGVRDVVKAIASCKLIVSSSLHGLVIADSLRIPNAYVQLQDIGVFKFRDYYSVYGESLEINLNIEQAFSRCRERNIWPVVRDVHEAFLEFARSQQ